MADVTVSSDVDAVLAAANAAGMRTAMGLDELLAAKAAKAGETYTGTHDFSGADVVLPAFLPADPAEDGVLTSDPDGELSWTPVSELGGIVDAVTGRFDEFNILRFGAVGDGSTDCTTAIQSAIDAAAIGGGNVVVPSGTFLTDELTFPRNVGIVGFHRITSVLKSSGAGTLLTFQGEVDFMTAAFSEIDTPLVHELTFDGDGVGTIGVALRDTSQWTVSRCNFQKFTDAGLLAFGAVTGKANDCRFIENATGIRAQLSPSSPVFGDADLPPNLLTLNNCVVVNNTYRGIDYSGGANLNVLFCDIETNGTNANAATGGLYCAAAAAIPGGYGLTMFGGWLEGNKGGFGIKIAAAAAAMNHKISDVWFYNYNNATHNITVDGSGAAANKVVIDNVRMYAADSIRDVHRSGANAEIVLRECFDDVVVSGSGGSVMPSPNLRFFAGSFQGYDGTSWVDIGTSGGSSDITSNLLLHYAFDDASGTSAADASGNSHTGTLVNTPSWTTGHIAGALSFNGTTQYVEATDIAAFHGATALTVAAWIYQAANVGDKGIVGKWDYATQGTFCLQTGTVDADRLTLYIADSPSDPGTGCRVDSTGDVLTAATWTHVAFVFDGTLTGDSNRVKLYVNGSQVAQTQAAGSVPAALTSATAALRVGCFGTGLFRGFQGNLDDVRIYTRALAAADIGALALL